MVVPTPWGLEMIRAPPTASTRSVMFCSPDVAVVGVAPPIPLSAIAMLTRRAWCDAVIGASLACECLATLASASLIRK